MEPNLNVNIDHQHIASLALKVREGTASNAERDEYMKFAFDSGQITVEQYDNYRNGQNVQAIVDTAIALGATFLLLYLISKVLD